MVRVKETFDSLAMLEFALDNMPDTPLLTEGFSYKPHAFALGFVEAPRGEDVHWSMLGDNQNCSAGAAVPPPTPTGRCCVTCCAAISFLTHR